MPLSYTVGTPSSKTVTITNATSASVSGLPSGITSGGSPSGSNYIVTLSGTPTTTGTGHIDIVATNDPGGCTLTTANTTGNTNFDWTVSSGFSPPFTAPSYNGEWYTAQLATLNPVATVIVRLTLNPSTGGFTVSYFPTGANWINSGSLTGTWTSTPSTSAYEYQIPTVNENILYETGSGSYSSYPNPDPTWYPLNVTTNVCYVTGAVAGFPGESEGITTFTINIREISNPSNVSSTTIILEAIITNT